MSRSLFFRLFSMFGISNLLILGFVFVVVITSMGAMGMKEQPPLVGGGCSLNGAFDREKFVGIMDTAGVFNGKADAFISSAEQTLIDPVLLGAIALHETGYGTSNAVVNKNNPGGLMDPSTGWQTLQEFRSLEEGILAMARNLNRVYITQGLITIEQIGAKYAPIGAANDPNGLNKNWVPNVTKIAMDLGGVMECELVEGDGEVQPNGYISPYIGNYVVTSEYGQRGNAFHAAIDLANGAGTKIVAVKDGTVVDSRYSSSYGNMVTIRHDDGLYTRYAHFTERFVSNGEAVKQGQIIGTEGNTGQSFGSHLHFEVRKENDYGKGSSINPREIIRFK